MSAQKSLTAAELFADDAVAHSYIQARAKHLVDFLQIDDDAFYKKIPHLQLAEPFKYALSGNQRRWSFLSKASRRSAATTFLDDPY